MKRMLALCLSIMLLSLSIEGLTITAIAESDGNLLLSEEFENSVGGFVSVDRTDLTIVTAQSDGMSGNVLEINSTKSGSGNYISYQKVLDEAISKENFVTLQFDIAAQYKDGKSRNIYFGAYDSYDNPLFLLNMSEGATNAKITVNGNTEKEIENMKPNGSSALSDTVSAGKSYRVTATFNFFNQRQNIKITSTIDESEVLLDETFDIDNAKNIAKLGMPVGINWTYGKIHIDNLTMKTSSMHNVKFNIADENNNNVTGAVITINGAAGKTIDAISEAGIAMVELPAGSYTYTVDGYPGNCTSITTPTEFMVNDDNTVIDIALRAFNGPTASSLELTADTDETIITASDEEMEIIYTAVVKDQDNNAMNEEKVEWNIIGTNNYILSGDNSGSTCKIIVPKYSSQKYIKVTATSKTYAPLTHTKELKIIGYPSDIDFIDCKESIPIPEQGSIKKEYAAFAKDSDGNKLKNNISYEITNAKDGVSIDTSTGVVTVTSAAVAGVFTIKAYAKSAPETYIEKEISITSDVPSGMMVDLMQSPAGVSITPQFSWIMNSTLKNQNQSAYQIIIASSEENIDLNIGDVWDSGKIESDVSVNVKYTGTPLEYSSGYYWKVKVWNTAGDESDYSAAQRFFTESNLWMADSIWTSGNTGKSNIIFARKDFTVNKEIDNALLNITAASHGSTRQYTYKAYINGMYVGLGPMWRTVDNQYFYNAFDVTDYIKPGENAIGAICYALSDKQLMAELKITYTDGTTDTIKTDSTWKVMDGTEAYGDNGESIGTKYYTAMAENINAQIYPYGWNKAGFDDSSWEVPSIKNKITSLTASPVDLVKEYEITPTKIIKKKDGNYFIDLGKEIIGGVKLEFEDIANPKTLEMRYGEECSSENTVKYEMRTGNKYLEFFTMKNGDQTFENFGMKNFRYIEILNSPVEITIENIKGIALCQEFDYDESYFISDNEVLNEIYEFCKYSIKATSQDMLVDSQSRERMPYEGDLYANQLSMYSFMRNYNLPRFTNEVLAYGPPSWCMEYREQTIMSAWEDYMYTGNSDSLKKLYNTLTEETQNATDRNAGAYEGKLLSYEKYFKPEYKLYQHGHMGNNGGTGQILVDWPNSQRDGYYSENSSEFLDTSAYNTVLNAFHYAAASDLSKIAEVIGETDGQKFYSKLADDLKTGIMKNLYVDSEKRFADAMTSDGILSAHFSQHASFYPLAFGIVDDEKIKNDIAKEIGTDGIRCSIYAAQFLLEAMYNGNNAEGALNMLTSTQEKKSWYHVIHNLGATIAPECWDPSQKGNMTLSHAWGTTPANIIVRNLCGIIPVEAGFKKIQIKPQLGGLKNVSVKAPNIRGYVYMDINTEQKKMSVNIPDNTTANIYVPFADSEDKSLYMDGVPVKATKENGYFVINNIGSGAHLFTVGEKAENNEIVSYSLADNILNSVTVKTAETAEMFVAKYNKDDSLLNVEIKDIDNIGLNTFPVNLVLSNDEYVKIYLWKSKSMQPLCNCKTITVN